MAWTVNRLWAYPAYEGQQDVVFAVDWSATLEDSGFSARVNGEQIVTVKGDFTPFQDLTESQVISWVHAAMGPDQVAITEQALLNQIAAQKNPPVAPIPMPLPWGE